MLNLDACEWYCLSWNTKGVLSQGPRGPGSSSTSMPVRSPTFEFTGEVLSSSAATSGDGIQPFTSSQRSSWSKILGTSMENAKMSCTKASGKCLGRNFWAITWHSAIPFSTPSRLKESMRNARAAADAADLHSEAEPRPNACGLLYNSHHKASSPSVRNASLCKSKQPSFSSTPADPRALAQSGWPHRTAMYNRLTSYQRSGANNFIQMCFRSQPVLKAFWTLRAETLSHRPSPGYLYLRNQPPALTSLDGHWFFSDGKTCSSCCQSSGSKSKGKIWRSGTS